ncbi:synaptobrevin homolog YKT6-like [Clavelina lepadiformis]|uniref:synaptobrevin homolog YKT6-like n=1 Tax=Clavelina lepadiformis TaxID=159417 RepID=UPI0040416EA6
MVKLFSMSLLYKGPAVVIPLTSTYDLMSFNYFQRKSIQEFMTFTTQIITERTQTGQRQSVKEQEYLCHVYVREDRLTGVIIADQDYPRRVAFTILSKACEDFASKVPSKDWPYGQQANIQYNGLEPMLLKYQDPKEADAMTRVQVELDETKIVLHGTMESLLQRGEKLDDLVAKSDALSLQSKTFYKQAKKANSWCCVIQ